MEFFVVGIDGRRYGPADRAMLVQWAREGRIAAGTRLIDCETGRQVLAGDFAELRPSLGGVGPAAPRPGAAPRVRVVETPPAAEPVRVYRQEPPIPSAPGHYHEMPGPKGKVAAGLLALLFPGLGLHRFYLGSPGIAILQILATFTCGVGVVWCVVEGVLCLTGKMRDSQGRLLRD